MFWRGSARNVKAISEKASGQRKMAELSSMLFSIANESTELLPQATLSEPVDDKDKPNMSASAQCHTGAL
jgi:hypothetical protein